MHQEISVPANRAEMILLFSDIHEAQLYTALTNIDVSFADVLVILNEQLLQLEVMERFIITKVSRVNNNRFTGLQHRIFLGEQLLIKV